MAYSIALLIHSYLRWVVVVLGVVMLVKSLRGWRTGGPWTPADNSAQVRFMAALDTQLLVGLLLYFVLSPVTAAFLGDFKAGMKQSQLRFFGMEHQFTMLLGIVLVHVARAVGKRKVDLARHKLAAITTIVFFVLVLVGTPWPGLVYGRPLFRMP